MGNVECLLDDPALRLKILSKAGFLYFGAIEDFGFTVRHVSYTHKLANLFFHIHAHNTAGWSRTQFSASAPEGDQGAQPRAHCQQLRWNFVARQLRLQRTLQRDHIRLDNAQNTGRKLQPAQIEQR